MERWIEEKNEKKVYLEGKNKDKERVLKWDDEGKIKMLLALAIAKG